MMHVCDAYIPVNNYPRWNKENITFPFLDSACKQAQEKSFWSCSLNFVPLFRELKKVSNLSDLGCRRRGGGGEFLSSAVFHFLLVSPRGMGQKKEKWRRPKICPFFLLFKISLWNIPAFALFFSLTQIKFFTIFTHSCARGGKCHFPALDAGGRLDAASDEEDRGCGCVLTKKMEEEEEEGIPSSREGGTAAAGLSWSFKKIPSKLDFFGEKDRTLRKFTANVNTCSLRFFIFFVFLIVSTQEEPSWLVAPTSYTYMDHSDNFTLEIVYEIKPSQTEKKQVNQ